MITLNVKLQIEEQYLQDLLDIAEEGRINYWVDELTVITPITEDNGEVEIVDADGDIFTITKKGLIKAIETFINDNPELASETLELPDAGITDSIVQIAIFGEVVYG